MNISSQKYNRFALCREMLETPGIVRSFRKDSTAPLAAITQDRPLLLTGEGSSRIFPAKRTRAELLRNGARGPMIEGATQAEEYPLEPYALLGASNSGRTRELVRLYRHLSEAGHRHLGAVTAHPGTPLEEAASVTHVLSCGPEEAVAATKSVAEQALVWRSVCLDAAGLTFPDVAEGADALETVLNAVVPEDFARSIASAGRVYFSGRNDGVAEELTLKTNEIVRKPSDFLEGTYAAHGIEEVMEKGEVVVLVDPFPGEEQKLAECLEEGAGVTVLAIAERETRFPTMRIPESGDWREFLLLAAGWNLLVEAGLAAGVDLDKPRRARKVGNEI